MNKNFTVLVFMLVVSMYSYAGEFVIHNHLGVNCLKHTVSGNETFYKIAQKYFIRPSTLAVVNSIDDVETVRKGTLLYIPLTETNFYTTKGINTKSLSFKPVYYQIVSESKLSEVAETFFVSIKNLQVWNKSRLPMHRGDKIVVGWVKFETYVDDNTTPLFVSKEKRVYGNKLERIEARQSSRRKESRSVAKEFPNYSVPNDLVPDNEIEILKEPLVQVQNEQQNKSASSSILENDPTKKRINEDDKRSLTKEQFITKAEQNYLRKKEKKTKQKKEGGLITKMRSFTRNSYARDKLKQREKQNIREAKQNKREVVPFTKTVSTKAPNQTIAQDKKKGELIDKSYAVEPVKVVEVEKSTKPVYVENKLQRLTLLKSMKGRVSFFYSGTAGAKFYVFTNLANKGGIIKLTNLSNNKYILAKVIGPLPETDRKQGYIVSLSDNSRRLIGVKSNFFTAKVNY